MNPIVGEMRRSGSAMRVRRQTRRSPPARRAGLRSRLRTDSLLGRGEPQSLLAGPQAGLRGSTHGNAGMARLRDPRGWRCDCATRRRGSRREYSAAPGDDSAQDGEGQLRAYTEWLASEHKDAAHRALMTLTANEAP